MDLHNPLAVCLPGTQNLCFGTTSCISGHFQSSCAEILYQSSSIRVSYFSPFSLSLSSLIHDGCEVAEPLSPLHLLVHYVGNISNVEKRPNSSLQMAARFPNISVFRTAFCCSHFYPLLQDQHHRFGVTCQHTISLKMSKEPHLTNSR